MSVRIGPVVPDTVDEAVTDPGWVARRDQTLAAWDALWRTTLPIYGGSVRAAQACRAWHECGNPQACADDKACANQTVETVRLRAGGAR